MVFPVISKLNAGLVKVHGDINFKANSSDSLCLS